MSYIPLHRLRKDQYLQPWLHQPPSDARFLLLPGLVAGSITARVNFDGEISGTLGISTKHMWEWWEWVRSAFWKWDTRTTRMYMAADIDCELTIENHRREMEGELHQFHLWRVTWHHDMGSLPWGSTHAAGRGHSEVPGHSQQDSQDFVDGFQDSIRSYHDHSRSQLKISDLWLRIQQGTKSESVLCWASTFRIVFKIWWSSFQMCSVHSGSSDDILCSSPARLRNGTTPDRSLWMEVWRREWQRFDKCIYHRLLCRRNSTRFSIFCTAACWRMTWLSQVPNVDMFVVRYILHSGEKRPDMLGHLHISSQAFPVYSFFPLPRGAESLVVPVQPVVCDPRRSNLFFWGKCPEWSPVLWPWTKLWHQILESTGFSAIPLYHIIPMWGTLLCILQHWISSARVYCFWIVLDCLVHLVECARHFHQETTFTHTMIMKYLYHAYLRKSNIQ